jgi:hypothetical protein
MMFFNIVRYFCFFPSPTIICHFMLLVLNHHHLLLFLWVVVLGSPPWFCFVQVFKLKHMKFKLNQQQRAKEFFFSFFFIFSSFHLFHYDVHCVEFFIFIYLFIYIFSYENLCFFFLKHVLFCRKKLVLFFDLFFSKYRSQFLLCFLCFFI